MEMTMSNEENSRYFLVKIQGDQLLMHNGQLADPLNEHTKRLKEFTSKKRKSDDDHIKIGEIEFQGGLYFDDTIGPLRETGAAFSLRGGNAGFRAPPLKIGLRLRGRSASRAATTVIQIASHPVDGLAPRA